MLIRIENVHKHIEKEPLTDENRWRIMSDAATEVGLKAKLFGGGADGCGHGSVPQSEV